MAHYSTTTPPSRAGRKRSGTMAELRVRLETALRGRYAVDREVGRGGMAIVYLAHDLRLERDVALKVLRPELAVTLGPDRFLQEIRLAAGLAHPHILPLHDSGEADGLLFYVMPFVRGESLRDRLEREHTLPMAEALRLAREVADALDYAHRAGVVHRDIKPENILLQDDHAVVADFGIARAISAAGAKRMTTAGMAVGTREYMSPEQAAGSKAVDGRSDIYSLGCMLFEMLTGNLPAIGTPPEGTAAGSGRATDRAAELTALRPSVPPEVAGVVARMLSAAPGERFQTAGELADALAAPTGVWTPRSLAAERRRRWGAGVAAAAGIGAAALWFVPRISSDKSNLGPPTYAVAPCRPSDPSQAASLSGDACRAYFRGALARFEDVTLTKDGQDEAGESIEGGIVIQPVIWQAGDSVYVRATLQSRSSGESPAFVVAIPSDLSDAKEKLDGLVIDLLVGQHLTPDVQRSAVGTRSIGALRAYVGGVQAEAKADLPAAEQAFHAALSADPAFPQAALQLALVKEWADPHATTWRDAARRAQEGSDKLDPWEAKVATAISALADGRFTQACQSYRELTAQDSLSFMAWYGLGECHRLDQRVVSDPRSPSGYAFQSSYQAAFEAYRRAFALLPQPTMALGDTAYLRLSDVLFTETNFYRRGFALAPDTAWYAAFPGLDHDTLSFIPYPEPMVLDSLVPPSNTKAVDHNRIALRQVTSGWVEHVPNNPTVLEVHALVLETTGEIAPLGSVERSALDAVVAARALTHDSLRAVRLAGTQMRLELKLGRFADARRLSDSLLALPNPSPAQAAVLAGAAELLGRADLAARLTQEGFRDSALAASDGKEVRAPPDIMSAAWRLLAYASLGRPRDSIISLQRWLEQLIPSFVAPPQRASVRSATLDLPAVQAFPELGVTPRHRADADANYLLPMQYALAHGDTAAVLARFARLQRARPNGRPGDVAIDGTFHEAWLRLALGDTATATHLLDASLNALPTLGTYLVWWPEQPAGLVRAMALRAQLAARAGDSATAARWAQAVRTLWGGADAAFQPLVDSLGALAAPGRRH
jgi:serine/threonine protein kinase/tetratricopeptide (TPR) repeat protein